MFDPSIISINDARAIARKICFDMARTKRLLHNTVLDAADILWFASELEHLDPRVYMVRHPDLQGRSLIPSQELATWTHEYTYRMFEVFGKAKWISNMSGNLPQIGADGTETTKVVKPLGDAYAWNWFELLAIQATGRRLDEMKARGARFAVDTLIDETLAYGETTLGLEGLYTLANIGSYTLATKAASGVHWGTLANRNATGDEVAEDLRGMASARVTATKHAWSVFDIVLPSDMFEYASSVRIGDNLTTALDWALKSPHIRRIVPWDRGTASLSNNVLTYDTIMCYPFDPMVLASLIPLEFTQLPVQTQGLMFSVPCVASCGGVVSRYPVAISKAQVTTS